MFTDQKYDRSDQEIKNEQKSNYFDSQSSVNEYSDSDEEMSLQSIKSNITPNGCFKNQPAQNWSNFARIF